MKTFPAYVAPSPATDTVARPTTTIRTDSYGRQLDRSAVVLVLLPDGSLGSREGCLSYDRQQTCPYHDQE